LGRTIPGGWPWDFKKPATVSKEVPEKSPDSGPYMPKNYSHTTPIRIP